MRSANDAQIMKQSQLSQLILNDIPQADQQSIAVSPNRIAEIVANRRRITADTALRLSLYFANSPEFWMNFQTHYSGVLDEFSNPL